MFERRQCALKYVLRKGENKPDVSSPPQYRFGEDKRPRVQDRDYTDSEASTFVQSRFNSAERSLFSTNGIHCNPEYSRYVALKCLNTRIETAECKVLFLRSIGEKNENEIAPCKFRIVKNHSRAKRGVDQSLHYRN